MSNWKHSAKQLLSSSFKKVELQDLYKKVTGNTARQQLKNDELIDQILEKIKTPHDLLKKQEITVAILRSYLKLDPKDTTFSAQELKNMVIGNWELVSSSEESVKEETSCQFVLSPSHSAAPAPSVPVSGTTTTTSTATSTSTSSSTATSTATSTTTTSNVKRTRESATEAPNKRKKEVVLPPPTRILLNNWWKVTNCVTDRATCSGITDSGFIVTPAFPNRDLATDSEIPGEGNVTYVLGNHVPDGGDQIEDNFGPWPAKMSGLNAVHLQFRSLQSESVTDFSTRLGMSVSGSRLDHLSSSMLLFNTLKLLNATEVRKILKKAVDGTPGCDATPFPAEIINRLVNEFNVPIELITAVDQVEQQKEQLNDSCLEVHKILYLKDKKQVLQVAMNQGQANNNEGEPANRGLPLQIYQNRLRSLDACEKRAAKCREEMEIEKNELERARRIGLEAQRIQQCEQDKAQLAAIEWKISSRNKTISRLQANAQMISQDILQTRVQISEVRNKMSASILLNGTYDAHLKIENDALSCSLAGLQETLQCINDQIEVETQSYQKESKQLRVLQSKINDAA